MSEPSDVNVYAAPETVVESELPHLEESPEYHLTGTIKVIVFYVLSFGLYSAVWFYQQWRQQKIIAGVDCWPVPRAIFSIFFAYPLFSGVKSLAEDKRVSVGWGAGLMAALYIIASILANVSEHIFVDDSVSVTVVMLFTVMILFVPALVLFYVQKAINSIYQGKVEDMNEKFTLINWIFTVILLGWWGMIIFGLTMAG